MGEKKISSLEKDPIINVVNNQWKQSINLLMEQECFGPALVLLYSYIDALVYLSLPENESLVGKKRYCEWCRKYLNIEGDTKVKDDEIYDARCGMVHNFTSYNPGNKNGNHRIFGYLAPMKDQDYSGMKIKPVIYNEQVNPNMLIVHLESFIESFFKGMDHYLIDLFQDKNKSSLAEKRFQNMFQTSTYSQGEVDDAKQ